MSTTTLVPTSTVPMRIGPPVVHIKQYWSDNWDLAPTLIFESGSICVASQDMDQATFSYRYGLVKMPNETESRRRTAQSPMWYWVRVQFYGTDGKLTTAFVGQICSEQRTPFGPSIGGGKQTYTAYGPLQILRKIHVDRSFWYNEDDGPQELDWVPDLNLRDRRGMSTGNRSEDKVNGVYVFGGDKFWTYYQFVEYILAAFVNVEDSDGPRFTLGGQASILNSFGAPIRLGDTSTVADLLKQLIPARFGLDYMLRPTSRGFEICVFSLSSTSYSFGDQTIPANPGRFQVAATDSPDYTIELEQTTSHAYGTVRVIGNRLLVCCSLWGNSNPATLWKKWSADLQQEYDGGPDTDNPSAEEVEEFRRRPRFNGVYRDYGTPDDWDFNGGNAAPYCTREGEIVWDEDADKQMTVRETLSWLPLENGIDYTNGQDTDEKEEDEPPSFRSLAVWISHYRDPADPTQLTTADLQLIWTPAERFNPPLSASPLKHEWGVHIAANPNYLLAGGISDAVPRLHDPVATSSEIAATIAFYSDTRLRLEKVAKDDPAYGVLVIHVPEAECWVLCSDTIVGVDEAGTLQYGGDNRVLRCDTELLEASMAGAIARYNGTRACGRVIRRGLWAWNAVLGQILTAVGESGGVNRLDAPVTSIHWTGGKNPQTTIGTGYAS